MTTEPVGRRRPTGSMSFPIRSGRLGHMRPVAVAHQQVGDPQPSLFDATSMLANLRLLGFIQFPIPNRVDVPQQGGLVALYGKETVPT